MKTRHSNGSGGVGNIPVIHDDCTIILGLFGRVVPVMGAVVGPLLQDREFLLEVAGEEGEEGDGWEDDVGDEGGDDGCEGCRETKTYDMGCLTMLSTCLSTWWCNGIDLFCFVSHMLILGAT